MGQRRKILMFVILVLTVACAPAVEPQAPVEGAAREPAVDEVSVETCGSAAVAQMVERFTDAPGTVFVVVTTTLWARWLEGSLSQPIIPSC